MAQAKEEMPTLRLKPEAIDEELGTLADNTEASLAIERVWPFGGVVT